MLVCSLWWLIRYFQEHEQLKNCGLDLYKGVVRDNKKADVFEPGLNHDPQD